MNRKSLRICIFCGARPNFMKVAPIIKAISRQEYITYTLVYAGGKDDPTIEDKLFEELQIMPPTEYLGADSANLNELTGQVMSMFELYLQTHPTDVVIVVDDLASTMAAAIVTKKQALTLVHIAAGTRSFDITMPKEINRLVIDGLSDILFTAGVSNNSIANKEGAELSKVYMVGNILIDNIRNNRKLMTNINLSSIKELANIDIKQGKYLLFTINRKKLLNEEAELYRLLKSLIESSQSVPIIAPLRPSATAIVKEIALKNNIDISNFHIIPPLGFLEFSYISAHAMGVVTDSGNVAEEATFNGVPCITLNSYTEHIETVTVGSNVLVGENPDTLSIMVKKIINGKWKKSGIPDRWDGRSAERIVQILLEL